MNNIIVDLHLYLAYSGILNGPISFNIIIRTIGYLYGQATLIKLTAIK